MAILPIKIWGDPVLTRRADAVDRISVEDRKLIKDMIETMDEADGAGLAAPQVGVSKRIFVFRRSGDVLAIVNPKIVKREGGRKIGSEGCLSIPGVQGKVSRSTRVTVVGRDQRGKPVEWDCEDSDEQGRASTCVQHELDHLDGILYIDKVEPDSIVWVHEGEVDEDGDETTILEETTLDEIKAAYKQRRLPPGVRVPEILRQRIEGAAPKPKATPRIGGRAPKASG